MAAINRLNRLSQHAPGLSLVFADEYGNVGRVEIARAATASAGAAKDFEISHRAEPVHEVGASSEARTYKVGACQALGEPRFPHFSTLPGGQLSASVSRLPASGGS